MSYAEGQFSSRKGKEGETAMNNQTDYKNLNGKVASCIRPPYLSGAGKTGETIKRFAQIMGVTGNKTRSVNK